MKDLKISKELASEVLGVSIIKYTMRENDIIYFTKSPTFKDVDIPSKLINIYEFAFKCKEWAYQNNYDMWSITWGAVEFQNNIKSKGTERIDADTEVEAIIEACTWILKEI